MLTLEEDRLITAAAESDPDARHFADEQMSAMAPIRALRGLASWRIKSSCFRSDIVLRLLITSGLLDLAGKLAWMLFSKSMSKLTPLAMQRGPNIKIQKTGANGVSYANAIARF